MQLPVDARNAPFKEKYLDEETPMFARWIIFGRRPDGTVDLDGGQFDVIIGLPPEKADAIVAARNVFCDAMLEIING